MLRWPAWLALLWLLFPGIGWAAEPVALPALTTRVTDLTGTLDATQRGRLEAQLAAIDRSGRAQIAVLLLPTTQPEPIEAFGIRLAEGWKIGHKGADNGLIVIVAKDDRKMRIEVGYGLEGAVPDAIAKRIVAERMAPRFKQGDFFGGLTEAVTALAAALAGEAPPAVKGTAPASTSADGGTMYWLMALLMFANVARRMLGSFGALAISGLGAWIAYSVFASVPLAVAAAVLVFLLSFARFGGTGSGGGDWSSGGGSSAGGGSFSDSGFSGGGGSFGGGGASGDW